MSLSLQSNYITSESIYIDGELVPEAQRSVITINQLEGYKNLYEQKSTMKTKDLLEGKSAIALSFVCEENIPSYFSDKQWIRYFFLVNGEEYEVQPLNSHRSGTKIIKQFNKQKGAVSTKHIEEPIKKAHLKIIIETPEQNISPFISELKILYGEAV